MYNQNEIIFEKEVFELAEVRRKINKS